MSDKIFIDTNLWLCVKMSGLAMKAVRVERYLQNLLECIQ